MRLRSRRVLLDGLLRPASLRIEDGAIAAIDPWDAGGDDHGDLVVMAGLVDTHVHLNEPGRTEWEGFASATLAAAKGGVTTLVDMPLNCVPVTVDAEALEVKLAAAQGQLRVDCGFWGGVVPANRGALGGLCRCGALGAKAFLCDSGIPEFPASDEDRLRSAMRELKDAGRPLLAHAELVDDYVPVPADPRAYTTYLRSRPARWEVRAIELLVRLCRETGCAVHIVHLSAAAALPVIAAAKEEGLPLTVETCPHYLGLAAEAIPDGATEYKCAPPIREEANAEALWAALGEGTIDLVVSDHSPCVPALKLAERGDFLEAWGGIAGLQLGLSSVWTGASARGYRVAHVARWMSERPAAFAGLRGKGRIAVGYRADLVAWDPDARWTVQPDDLLHRHPVSPWVGRTLRGRVHKTWLGGAAIWDDGPVGAPGAGRCGRAWMPEPRTVALDVGSKTIGLAEDAGAGPKPIRTHRRLSVARDVEALLPWIGDADVVVGLPSYDDGGESASTRRARQVGDALTAAGRTVHYQDERFTTAEAEERLRDAGVPRARWPELVDAWAAAVILEDWRAGR